MRGGRVDSLSLLYQMYSDPKYTPNLFRTASQKSLRNVNGYVCPTYRSRKNVLVVRRPFAVFCLYFFVIP